mmetsp:Transcript_32257/g.68660  ORF Transcript_32257/g.68660 Transcript_32257/m.68660 type:complete len:264 (+) Transcript_32257:220-1011(+)
MPICVGASAHSWKRNIRQVRFRALSPTAKQPTPYFLLRLRRVQLAGTELLPHLLKLPSSIDVVGLDLQKSLEVRNCTTRLVILIRIGLTCQPRLCQTPAVERFDTLWISHKRQVCFGLRFGQSSLLQMCQRLVQVQHETFLRVALSSCLRVTNSVEFIVRVFILAKRFLVFTLCQQGIPFLAVNICLCELQCSAPIFRLRIFVFFFAGKRFLLRRQRFAFPANIFPRPAFRSVLFFVLDLDVVDLLHHHHSSASCLSWSCPGK